MEKRVIIYARLPDGSEFEVLSDLRQAVEARGDTIIATFVDDALIVGRGKYAGWRKLIAGLGECQQVVVANAGALPGKGVPDLLKLLAIFRRHGVALCLHTEGITTDSDAFALLAIIEAYRSAKLSQAIKAGQARALATGKRIGRPQVPPRIRDQIQACLADGGGVRPTARRFGVSPASVVNLRRAMPSRCSGDTEARPSPRRTTNASGALKRCSNPA